MNILKMSIFSMLLLVSKYTYAESYDGALKWVVKVNADRAEEIFVNELMSEVSENKYIKFLFPVSVISAPENENSIGRQRLIPLYRSSVELDVSNQVVFLKNIAKRFHDGSGDIISKTAVETEYKRIVAIFECSSNNLEMNAISEKIKSGKDYNCIDGNNRAEAKRVTDEDVEKLIYVLSAIYTIVESLDDQDSSVVKLNYALVLIEMMGSFDESRSYVRAKKTLMRLAAIHDGYKSGSDEGAVSVINNYKDMVANSFPVKRNSVSFYGSFTDDWYWPEVWPFNVGVGSYFGGGLALDNIGNDESGNVSNFSWYLYGPVGFEFKLADSVGGRYHWFTGIALLDIGAPIYGELTGKEYEADFNDIRSTSFYLSVSRGMKPWSVLLSFHPEYYDPQIDYTRKHMTMLSFAIDLPLLF
ncbi:MAG: hypothetical protein CMI09_15020 [Oceanospirillaceae bacterium]|nr:hypothetical protein [Oceanospirillaceae bacterium]